jgi:hypothetical protein
MKFAIFASLFAGLLSAVDPPQVFTGTVTDTMCGAHHTMVKGATDVECLRLCIKSSSHQYALYDGKSIIRLSDQKMPAKFGAQAVKVTGTYSLKTNTIKVITIEAAN